MATPSKDLSDTVHWFLYCAPMGTQTYRNNNNTQRHKTRYTQNGHNDSVTQQRHTAAIEEEGDRRPDSSTPHTRARQDDEAEKVCF